MREKHYKPLLSAFVNHELSKSEQQLIATHLMQCTDCRNEHDRIKLGATFAALMSQSDAPISVWNHIETSLDRKTTPQMALIPDGPFFGLRNLAGYAAAFLMVGGLIAGAYFMLFRPDPTQTNVAVATPDQTRPAQPLAPDVAVLPANVPANVDQSNSNIATSTNSNTVSAPAAQPPALASGLAWQFETLSGSPKVGEASTADRLAVGDFLETDAASRARIEVADIGNVEIQPNSRVKLVGTNPKQHRLSLEHGILQAQIAAPPRLFIVDTPSAVAVDLGCAYKLEVDKRGNSYLHVTSGLVALERGGRESIVLAGAMCITKRGKGLGTPFSAEASEKFRAALHRFDFSNGGSRAVETMLDNRSFYDMITLWHLLSRVKKVDRAKVLDALASYVALPSDVTREGILALDKKMLTSWRLEMERAWFQ